MVEADDEVLFPLPAKKEEGEGGQRVEAGPVEKTFRSYDQSQMMLMPPSLEEWLRKGHLARWVSELVEEGLDLSPIYASYTEERGYPPYDPRLMLKLLIYGYCTGQRSSRGIEQGCWDQVGFRYLSAGAVPDYRSIARFRRRHLEALEGLFVQALELCEQAGLVQLGRVALDGTKLRANASRHKAMSYERMAKREEELAAEVRELLADAERVDQAEEERLVAGNRDQDLPQELSRREDRLQKIREAKAALEEAARQEAAEKAAATAEKRGKDEASVKAAAEEAAATAKPKPKAQSNFTDPDARIMKMSDGAFQECYNGQIAVDEEHQVIVASDLGQCASDAPSLLPMAKAVEANCGGRPEQLLADAGYCSEANLLELEAGEVDAYVSPRRRREDARESPEDARNRMAGKVQTPSGREAYARRKAIVEPVFGQLMVVQKARHLLLRGLSAARSEWLLLCACHNFRKLFGATQGGGELRQLATAS